MNPNLLIPIRQHYKADICFFQSFKSLKNRTLVVFGLQLITFLIFGTLYIIDDVESDDLSTQLLLITLSSILGIIPNLFLLSNFYWKVDKYLLLSALTNHYVEEQPVTDFSSIKACTSQTVYIKENQVRREDLSQNVRKNIIKITRIRISSFIAQLSNFVRAFSNMASGFALASMGFSLYVLFTVDMPIGYIVIISLFVFITFCRQIIFIFLLLLLALSPLICILICFFCCCCSPNKGGNFINLPSKQATQADMINCEGICAICRMNIDENSKIYELPCSQKHIFHSICLSQWARVRNTCPNCRGEIPMTHKGRQSQIRQQSQNEA